MSDGNICERLQTLCLLNWIFFKDLSKVLYLLFPVTVSAGDQSVSCSGCCWADMCDTGPDRNQRSEVNTMQLETFVIGLYIFS